MNDVRCRLARAARSTLFPGAGERESAVFWTGLRPATRRTCRSSAAPATAT